MFYRLFPNLQIYSKKLEIRNRLSFCFYRILHKFVIAMDFMEEFSRFMAENSLEGRLEAVPVPVTSRTPEAAEVQAEAMAPLAGRATFVAEDRWRADGDALRARLLAHAGHFRQVYARNCTVRRIERAAAARFLSETHSYGDALSRFRYGLFVERVTGEKGPDAPAPGTLVAVATFSKARARVIAGRRVRSHEWVRYASLPGIRVEGGMGKLLDAFVAEVRPEDVMTYADLEWSDGRAYRELGFALDSVREPVMFAVDPVTWERNALKYVSDMSGMLFFRNFGSLKFRKSYI